MAQSRRRRSTGSKRYVVRNPRGIAKDSPILRTRDGDEWREGEIVSADELTDTARRAFLKRGQIEEA